MAAPGLAQRLLLLLRLLRLRPLLPAAAAALLTLRLLAQVGSGLQLWVRALLWMLLLLLRLRLRPFPLRRRQHLLYLQHQLLQRLFGLVYPSTRPPTLRLGQRAAVSQAGSSRKATRDVVTAVRQQGLPAPLAPR